MKSSLRLSLLILLSAVLLTCRKEEAPENPPFDPQKASSSLVSINTSEIGGNNLSLLSFYDENSPLSRSTFNTVVSKEGEQLLFVADGNKELRGLTLSTPGAGTPEIMKIDVTSTAVSLVFISPGILTTDPSQARTRINEIKGLSSFSTFRDYLKTNLVNSSISQVMKKDTVYNYLLEKCILEYYNKVASSKGSPTEKEKKNFFSVNLQSETSLEFRNHGFRYVAVAERDMGSSNSELRVKTLLPWMGGVVPVSWGSIITWSTLEPSVKTSVYEPITNTSYSEFWVVGPGWKQSSDTPPQSIQAVQSPWVQTIIAYVVFPLIDVVGGTTSWLQTGNNPTKFAEFMEKVQVSTSAGALAMAENGKEGLREIANFAINLIGPYAAAAGVPVVGQVLGGISAVFGTANLGLLCTYLSQTEKFARFNVNSVSGPPAVPILLSPPNNSSSLELPLTLNWKALNAESYRLEISRNIDFLEPAFEENGITSGSKTVSAISYGKSYYWRVRSINRNNTSMWSDTWKFTTVSSVPEVTTATPESITFTSAVLGGEVVSDGGDPVTESGIYYGELQNPDVNGSKIMIGSGTGVFKKTITGLLSGRTYYVTAYAINSKGKSLGRMTSFITPAQPAALTGKITGIVRDAMSGSPLSAVSVQVFLGNELISSASTSSDGKYEVSIPVNSGYTVVFGKPGYIDATYQDVNVTANLSLVLEPILQINTEYSGNGIISGSVKSALNGTALAGVTLNLRKGMNVQSGTIYSSTTSSASGIYTFNSVEGGNYTLEAIKSGYNVTYLNVISLGGLTSSGQDISMSPVLSEGTTRIVLSWGSVPADLDSHFTGPLSDGTRFHIYYGNLGSNPWSDIVMLDLDDVDSYGPETTTLSEQIDGVYRFSVHDFSNRSLSASTALSNSGAQVRVYRNTGLVATFNVPPDTGGTLWTVFEMNGSTITVINQMSYIVIPSQVTRRYRNTDNELFINLPLK